MQLELQLQLDSKIEIDVEGKTGLGGGVKRGMEIAVTWPDWFKINVIISISWRVFAAVPTFNYATNRTAKKANGNQNQYHFVPSF